MGSEHGTTRRNLLTGVVASAGALVATRLGAGEAHAQSGPDPWFDVTAFGAKGDGTTDDTASIQAALDAAGSGNYPLIGGVVFMPRGAYMISSRLVVPWRVSLIGVGRDATTIKALSSFPPGRELVRLGDMSGDIGESSRIENLTVHCSDITGSVGIYSERMNEQCGVFRTEVQNFGAYGIWINQPNSGGPPQHWSIDDVEIFTGPATPASAIAIAVTMRSYGMPIRQISRVTVFASSYTPLTTAIRLDGLSAGRVSDVHVEGCVNGVLAGSGQGCYGTVFMNLDGMSNVTNLLVWSNTGQPSPQQSLVAIGLVDAGATHTLVDQVNGNTLTGPVAFYSMGGGGGTDNAVLSTDYSLPTRLRRVQVLADLRRSTLNLGFAASFTPDPTRGEVQMVTLTGGITVNNPANSASGQKLVFMWTQDATGGRRITYGSHYLTGGVPPVNTTAGTTTIDEFLCVGGNYWRLCGRITGQ
jgi:hypothetical protein